MQDNKNGDFDFRKFTNNTENNEKDILSEDSIRLAEEISNETPELRGESSSSNFLRFCVNLVLFPIIIGAIIWFVFGYADGVSNYDKDYSSRSTSEAIKLFQQGRYYDSKECFYKCYGKHSQLDNEFYTMAKEMSFYFFCKNHYKHFRIFFKWPSEMSVSREEFARYALPDFVKEEIYEMAMDKYSYINSDSSPEYKETASICFKMCGKYKDSESRYQNIMKMRLTDAIAKRDFKAAREIILEIKDKKVVADFQRKINNEKYQEAKEKIALGDLKTARNTLRELADKGVKEAKELYESVNLKLVCRRGIHIKGNLKDEKAKGVRLENYNRGIAEVRQEASDYLAKNYGLGRAEMPDFCQKKLREFADEAYNEGNHLEAYNNYTLAVKNLASEPRILECATILASQPKKIGGVILLGSYEQDNNPDNGKEPIEWIIAAISDDKALLISKYVLAVKKMHEIPSHISWTSSDLRKWLNENFYNDAFTEEERKKLLQMELATRDFRNRSMHGMGQFENPFLYKLLGAKNYTPSEGILDYVTCPDDTDLKYLREVFDQVAYAVPSAVAEKYADHTNSYAHFKNIKYNDKPKKKLLWINKENEQKNVSSDSASISNDDEEKANTPCYEPCEYWLRDWTSASGNNVSFASIDKYGMRSSDNARVLLGVRPVIMIKILQSEAVPREKDAIDKVEDSFKKLKAVQQMGVELRKHGLMK